MQRCISTAESRLTFQKLDEKEITSMLERISVNWEHFVESSDLGAHTAAMVELGMLAEKHIYFRLLYTRCFGCISVNGFDQAEIQAIALDLKEFVKQFSRRENMVSDFFVHVICRTGWSYIYEVISHDLSYDEAQIFMKSIREFCFAGWGKVLGQNYEDLGL